MVIQSEGIALRISKHVNEITVAAMNSSDTKIPMQAMLNDSVDIKTMKTPSSARKSNTGNCANVLARAMLHDTTYDGMNDRLETYRSSSSGFNSGDSSNFVNMIFGIIKANNLINGSTVDLGGLSNAVQALVSNFLDGQTDAKNDSPDTNNPFNGLSATDTATTTVEQVEDEEDWEEYDDEPITGLSPTNIRSLTNEIINDFDNGVIHPAVTMVKQRLLAQDHTTTISNGNSTITVQLYYNGKNRKQSVHKLEHGTDKQTGDQYFLTWPAYSVGMNLLGLYSQRGGGKRNAPVAWATDILREGTDKVVIGAFGVAVMHLAEPHMIDKNGNQLNFTHDLRKYVETSFTDSVKEKLIDVALANSPAMQGNYEVAKDWNLSEYTPYDRASKPKTARTLL